MLSRANAERAMELLLPLVKSKIRRPCCESIIVPPDGIQHLRFEWATDENEEIPVMNVEKLAECIPDGVIFLPLPDYNCGPDATVLDKGGVILRVLHTRLPYVWVNIGRLDVEFVTKWQEKH